MSYLDASKTVQLGPDSIDFYEDRVPEGLKEIAYWYEHQSYEGGGIAIAKFKGGYSIMSLNHCSCNWPPSDGDWAFIGKTKTQVLKFLRTDGGTRDNISPGDYDYEEVSALIAHFESK